jgi:hypothetical protein
MRLRLIAAGLALTGLLTAGCHGPLDPAQNTVDTFTGTVGVLQAQFHSFNVSQNGEFFVTLNTLTPPLPQITFPTDVQVTAAVSGTCIPNSQIVSDNPNAQVKLQALFGTITPGLYCVWVIDAGYFSTAESYTITVSHP